MKKSLLILGLIISTLSYAQNKYTYYTKDWKVTTKDSATYYRPQPKKVNGLWLIKDYYINGKIQFKGYSTGENNERFQGDATWYYPNGKIQDKVRFKDGVVIGYFAALERVTATPEEGYDEDELYFIKKQKIKKVVDAVGAVEARKEVADAVTKDSEVYQNYYANSKQIAQLYEIFVGYEDKRNKSTFYNKNGSLIGELIYNKQGEKDFGTDVIFYESKDCNTDPECDYISIKKIVSYAEGKKIALKYYTEDGRVISSGTFQNEKPFQGTFFKEICNFYKIISYKNGVIQKEVVFLQNHKEIATAYYHNGKVYKGTYYDCEGYKNYKNGKISGKVVKFDRNKSGDIETEFQYKDGYKNGPYRLYDYGNLLEQGTYNNSMLIGDIWYYFHSEEESTDDSYKDGNYSFKLEVENNKVKKISKYDADNNLSNEFVLEKSTNDTYSYLINGYHELLIADYNSDGHDDFAIKANYFDDSELAGISYYIYNPNTRLYKYCNALKDKEINFDAETNTLVETKNDRYDSDFEDDLDYVTYKTKTYYHLNKNCELLKIKEIDYVTKDLEDTEEIKETQIFPLQTALYPLQNSDIYPITFTQNHKKQILGKPIQEITLTKDPFSISFPLIANETTQKENYNTRIVASQNKSIFDKVGIGTRTKKTAFFRPGTAIASYSNELSLANSGHNHLTYTSSSTENKVRMIKKAAHNIIVVSYDIDTISYDFDTNFKLEHNTTNPFFDKPIYLLIFTDKNRNERIEEGELYKVKLVFKNAK